MDLADLYDHEVVAVGRLWKELMDRFARKPNTRANLQELAKVANDEFLKLGLVVNVRWENNLMVDPRTMQPYPIEIEVLGRVPGGTGLGELVEGHELMDHERKRFEVLRSVERNEEFYGDKGRSA